MNFLSPRPVIGHYRPELNDFEVVVFTIHLLKDSVFWFTSLVYGWLSSVMVLKERPPGMKLMVLLFTYAKGPLSQY